MKHKIAFALIMGVITTGIISFTLISVNLGFSDKFLKTLVKILGYGICRSNSCYIDRRTFVQKIVDKLFKEKTVVNESK